MSRVWYLVIGNNIIGSSLFVNHVHVTLIKRKKKKKNKQKKRSFPKLDSVGLFSER